MRLQQLLNRQKALKAEFKAYLEKVLKACGDEKRAFSAEETAKADEYRVELASVEGQIQAEHELAALSAPDASPASASAPARTPTTVADAGIVPRVEVVGEGIMRDPFRGFREGDRFAMGEFALAVRAACRPGGMVDDRLVRGGLMPAGGVVAAPTNFHQETGAVEGAMVPTVVSQAIWQLVFSDPLLDLITVEPTSSNVVEMLGDETTPWGASGVVAAWRSEGVQMTPSKLDTKTKQVRLHELYAFVLATEEILEDAPRLTDRLNVKAPAAIRWKFVEALMFGTGAGQPLGWANAGYTGAVALGRKTGSQINPDDFVKMYSRLLVQDGPDRSFFVVNRDTLPDIVLRSVIGNVPIWLPPSGLAGAPNGTILGRPLFFSEHCQTLGTAGDAQLVNPDGYYATQRGPARQDSSIHLFFDYAITAFRWMFRFGGQPMLSAAVSPAKGANTKSHFVILT